MTLFGNFDCCEPSATGILVRKSGGRCVVLTMAQLVATNWWRVMNMSRGCLIKISCEGLPICFYDLGTEFYITRY